jgi:hypothetical protein
MPATTYFENQLLRYAISSTPFVVGAWWLALYADEEATTEITSPSYPRQLVTWDSAYYNSNLITFSIYAGPGATVRACGVCNVLSGGNLLVFGSTALVSLTSGRVLTVPIGSLHLDVPNIFE